MQNTTAINLQQIKTGYYNMHGDDPNACVYVTGTPDNAQVHYVTATHAFKTAHDNNVYYFADVYDGDNELYVITNDNLRFTHEDTAETRAALTRLALAYFARDVERFIPQTTCAD